MYHYLLTLTTNLQFFRSPSTAFYQIRRLGTACT